MLSKLGAEAVGTFVLVFGGCGSAVFAALQVARELDEPTRKVASVLGALEIAAELPLSA